jgi:hypothetical protein
MKRRTLLIALAALLALGGVALAGGGGGGLAVNWYVIGGGGGPVASGAADLDATVGQPVAGTINGGGYTLCSGYWCGHAEPYRVYLPLVVKQAP